MANSGSHLPLEPSAFTNYGLFEPWPEDLLSTNLDTWYYLNGFGLPYDVTGSLLPGIGPITASSGIEPFLRAQFEHLLTSSASLLRLGTYLNISYQTTYPSVGVPLHSMPSAWLHDHSLVDPTWLIRGADADLDVALIVRTFDGTLEEKWLKNMGVITFRASFGNSPMPPIPIGHRVPWTASLDLKVDSIFQPDNEKILRDIRREWKQWVKVHPEQTWMADTGLEPVVTLVEPPANTPADNRELSAANLPRLRRAITAWESRVGAPFAWNLHPRDL